MLQSVIKMPSYSIRSDMTITVMLKAAIGTCREQRALAQCETDSYDVTHQTGGTYLRVRKRRQKLDVTMGITRMFPVPVNLLSYRTSLRFNPTD